MGGAWPGEAEAEKGEIGGDEVGSLSWAEGGEENFTQKEGLPGIPKGRVAGQRSTWRGWAERPRGC